MDLYLMCKIHELIYAIHTHLSESNFLHVDIKPSNIIFDDAINSARLMLIDYEGNILVLRAGSD